MATIIPPFNRDTTSKVFYISGGHKSRTIMDLYQLFKSEWMEPESLQPTFDEIIKAWKKRKSSKTKYTIDEIVASNPMTSKEIRTLLEWKVI